MFVAPKKALHSLIPQTPADPFAVPGSVARPGTARGLCRRLSPRPLPSERGLDHRAGICQARKGGRGRPSRGNTGQCQAEGRRTERARGEGREARPHRAASRGENVPSLHFCHLRCLSISRRAEPARWEDGPFLSRVRTELERVGAGRQKATGGQRTPDHPGGLDNLADWGTGHLSEPLSALPREQQHQHHSTERKSPEGAFRRWRVSLRATKRVLAQSSLIHLSLVFGSARYPGTLASGKESAFSREERGRGQ